MGAFRRVVGVDRDVMTCVGTVRRRHLEALSALRAKDEQGLTVVETMEALEGVESTKRDPLCGAAVLAGIGDLGEQPSQSAHHGGIAYAGCKDLSG